MPQALMDAAQAQAGQVPVEQAPAAEAAPVEQGPTEQQGATQGPPFKKPDVTPFIPKGMEDLVARVIAAGHKVMFAPSMRDQLVKNVKRNVAPGRKMAEGAVGLMLTIDKKVKGGIPEPAMVPVIMEFLSQAGEVLQAAGQPVTQQTYNEAFQYAYALIGKKLGKTDQQINAAAEQALANGGGGAPENEGGEPAPDAETGPGEDVVTAGADANAVAQPNAPIEQEPGEGAMHEQGETPPVEQQETQAEAAGQPEPDEQALMQRARMQRG